MTIVVNLDELRNAPHEPGILPEEAVNFLTKTGTNFVLSSEKQILKQKGHAIENFLKSINHAAKPETAVQFSHNLVKSGPNQWHIIEHASKGEGGFGAVNESKSKIVLERKKKSYSAKIVPVNDVVKIQKSSNEVSQGALLANAIKEAQMQSNQGVNVIGPIDAVDKVIIIMEDCGVSLDHLLPFSPSTAYSFDYRLSMAGHIAGQMLSLQQYGIVHRDLKPSNICYKRLSDNAFQITFIDFGFAEEVNSPENRKAYGTYYYMAPEVFTDQTTYASDMYALAGVLGELFGATDILKYKKEAYKKRRELIDLIKAPYCFDGLFKNYEVAGIDPYLLDDIRTLLLQLSNQDAKERPSIDHVNKFFYSIPERVSQYNNFNKEWHAMEQQYQLLEDNHSKLNLLKNRNTLDMFRRNFFNQPNATPNAFNVGMVQNKIAIENALGKLQLPKSHYNLALQLVKENRTSDFSGTDYPYPDIKPIAALIEKENNQFKKFFSTFEACNNAFIDSLKFIKSNSTGIHQIKNIMNSNLLPLEKLQHMKQIGAAKIEKGFWNSYSHSCFFGKGRHHNVDALYHRLAKLAPQNTGDYGAQMQLEAITQFINDNPTFTH